MRTYRTTVEVPWGDVLQALRWHLRLRLRQAREAQTGGLSMEEAMNQLETAYGASRALRRFLGRGETKLEQEAADLLGRSS